MRKLGPCIVSVLLCLGAAQALAQRHVIGMIETRTSVLAFGQADRSERLPPLERQAFTQPLRVLEFSPDESLVAVSIDQRRVWLDRTALHLEGSHEASCLEVASTHNAPRQGGPRSANSGCEAAAKPGKP